jgi:hypothetical protein
MSFSKPKPDPAIAEANKLQAERDRRLEERENAELRKLSQSALARKRQRNLLYSADRANPVLGIASTTPALSPVRNPMGTSPRYS